MKMRAIQTEFNKIDEEFRKYATKNRYELENAMIKPIDVNNFPFAQNGICAMIATMGSGKTHTYLKLACQQQALLKKEPFFELVVICSTSGKFDETVNAFAPIIQNKSKLVHVKDTDLLAWLNKYIHRMRKYNSFMKYLKKNEFDEELERIGMKHGFKFIDEKEVNKTVSMRDYIKNQDKMLEYITKKLDKYKWKTYPHRCLLIFDDFASHPLLKSRETDLSRLLKKLRHFHINVIICVQTTRSIPRDLKRCLSDIILFPGISRTDFLDLCDETGASALCDSYKLWQSYQEMYDPHGRFTIFLKAKKIRIEQEKKL